MAVASKLPEVRGFGVWFRGRAPQISSDVDPSLILEGNTSKQGRRSATHRWQGETDDRAADQDVRYAPDP